MPTHCLSMHVSQAWTVLTLPGKEHLPLKANLILHVWKHFVQSDCDEVDQLVKFILHFVFESLEKV